MILLLAAPWLGGLSAQEARDPAREEPAALAPHDGGVLWRASIGLGLSRTVVHGERLFVRGFDEQRSEDDLRCLDARDGRELWRRSFPAKRRATRHAGGTLTTPLVHGDRVFVSDREGLARAFDAREGTLLWETDVAAQLAVTPDEWGFAASPVLLEREEGEPVLVLTADALAGLDPGTGEVRWGTASLGVNFSTPAVASVRGTTLLLALADDRLHFVDPFAGKALGRLPWRATCRGRSTASPLVLGDRVFLSPGRVRGGLLLDLGASPPAPLWTQRAMQNRRAGCVRLGEHLYGFDESVLTCLGPDGHVAWRERGLGAGSVLALDGRLIVLTEHGDLIVADVSGGAFRELSRRPLFREGNGWSPPVSAAGRLYCRSSQGELVCLVPEPLATAMAATPDVPTGLELLDRHAELTGGAEAWAGVRSIELRGTLEIPSLGVERVPFSIQRARPLAFREVSRMPEHAGGEEVVRGFDGSVGWRAEPGQGTRLFSDAEARAAFEEDVFDWGRGWRSRYGDPGPVEAVPFHRRPAFRLSVTSKGGVRRELWFDAETGFLAGRAGEGEALWVFEDWQRSDGPWLPRLQRRFAPDTGAEEVRRLGSASVNTVPGDRVALPVEARELLEKRAK